MTDSISDMQAGAFQSLHGIQVDSSANEEDEDNEILPGQSPNKRPFIPNFPSIGPYSITGSTIRTSSSTGHLLSTIHYKNSKEGTAKANETLW